MSELMRERVMRGAALLDERDPGWAAEIDTGALDMADCWNCILGQRFHDYAGGLVALGLLDEVPDEARYFEEDDAEVDVLHGFELRGGTRRRENWRALEALWAEQIRLRTKPEPATP